MMRKKIWGFLGGIFLMGRLNHGLSSEISTFWFIWCSMVYEGCLGGGNMCRRQRQFANSIVKIKFFVRFLFSANTLKMSAMNKVQNNTCD
jgi:hypothetical protein